jgi:hypothetical protein
MREISNIGDDDQEDFDKLPSFLSGMRREEFAAVPNGYFDNLSQQIAERIEEEELFASVPVFSQIPKINPFTVPSDYFEELPESIGSAILLDSIGKKQAIPEHVQPLYFEELTQDITSAISLENLQIKKEDPFLVPADYFDWLPSRIQDRILATKKQAFTWAWLQHLLVPKYWVPTAFAALLLVFIGIRIADQHSLTGNHPAQFALSEKDKKEVIDNFELFGFDENIVMDHVSAYYKKPADDPAVSSDKVAEIDYLIDNNADVSAVGSEN